MKYLAQAKKQDEVGDDAIEINSMNALPNYLTDRMANIANGTLQIEQTPASISAFAKFPKHLGLPRDKSHLKKSARSRATHMSRAPSVACSVATLALRWQERGDLIEVEDIYQTHYPSRNPGEEDRGIRENTALLPPTLPPLTYSRPAVLLRRAGKDIYAFEGPQDSLPKTGRTGGNGGRSNLPPPTRPPPPRDTSSSDDSDPEPDWNDPVDRKRYLENQVNTKIAKSFRKGNRYSGTPTRNYPQEEHST